MNESNQTTGKRPRSINDQQESEILRLNHEGHNENQIARITGIPRTSVVRCLKYLEQDSSNDVKDNRQQNLERSIRYKERLERKAYLRQVRKRQQSDRRQKILELNHAGKTVIEIAKELGIGKGLVSADLKYLGKDSGNGVHDNRRDKWKTVCRVIRDDYLPYYESRGIRPTLRTVYYRLIAEGYIEKSENENNRLSLYTVKARLGEPGWPQLPINCFADDTREVISGYEDYEPTDPGDPTEPEDPDEYIKRIIQELKDAPGDYDPEGEHGDPGRAGGYWYNQSEYVAVWEEKAALASTFKAFLKDRHVDLIVNRGYQSLTFLYENCKDLKPIVDKFGEDHVHVLYFGDWDPSGAHIGEKIKEYFTIFGIPSPEKIFERVAITPEQIDEYNIQYKIVTARNSNGRFEEGENPNANWFVETYGNGETAKAADLDAFIAADDVAFEEIVQDSIDQYYDQSIYDQMVEDYEEVVNEPENVYEKDIAGMIAKITEAFKPGWEDEFYE